LKIDYAEIIAPFIRLDKRW